MYQQETQADENTVILSRKDMLAAQRLLRLLLNAERQSSDFLTMEPNDAPLLNADRDQLVGRARVDFSNRRRRTLFFGSSMFGEAAWDMLLALYILERSGQRQTLGSLMHFSGAPVTTAKRWLDYLVDHNFVHRHPHPTDKRTAFVSLTPTSREKLDMYYSGTVETEL
jgi:DNA-binding MarR family transcriptional regulator